MPPFLQQLKGYPVFTTGIVLAPRGAGMMAAMMITARLIGRFDARWMIAAGLLLCALSLYDMTLFNLDVSESHIVWNGVLLGFGLGLVFPPLTTLTFATLPPRLRTEGRGDQRAAAQSRRIGRHRRAGVAAVPQYPGEPRRAGRPAHALQRRLAVWPGHAGARFPDARDMDAEINRQAAMIGYLNDFRVMTICTLMVIPLLFFMRKQMLAR